MSNQFFNFIAKYTADYFEKSKGPAGERYYLQLNSQDDIHAFIKALNDKIRLDTFSYELPNGSSYETPLIKYDHAPDLIVAYNTEGVTPDFLVTIRNRTADQNPQTSFEGKSLLMLITSDLDSITGGSISLQSESMPFHPVQIAENVKKEVPETVTKRADQLILEQHIDQLDADRQIQFISFYDYKEILEIIMKGSLSASDYAKMELFQDDELKTFKGNNLRKRLEENTRLFNLIKSANENNWDDGEMEKYFMPEDVSALQKPGWETIPYEKIQKSHQQRIDTNKKSSVTFSNLELTAYKDDIHFYRRALSTTQAGKRKQQLLFFAGDQTDLQFDVFIDIQRSEQKTLKKEYLKPGKIADVEVKKNRLHVKIDNSKKIPQFDKIVYKHEDATALSVELHICVLPVQTFAFEKFKHQFEINAKSSQLVLPMEEYAISFGEVGDETKRELEENGIVIPYEEDKVLLCNISEQVIENEEIIRFSLKIDEYLVPIQLKGERAAVLPIDATKLAVLRQREKLSFDYEDGKVMAQEHQYSLKKDHRKLVEIEQEWIKQGVSMGFYQNESFKKNQELVIPEDLREAYSRFLTAFKTKISTLVQWDEEITNRAIDYLKAYHHFVAELSENSPAGTNGMNVFKLGTIYTPEEIWLTPFHPINVAFRLQLEQDITQEEIDMSVMERLRPDSLLPYLYGSGGKEYSPDPQRHLPGWIVYRPVDFSNVADADLYLNKVVKDKLKQFEKHFIHYFLGQHQAPIKVNVVNVLNDHQIIRGLLQWFVEKLNVNSKEVPVIDLSVYRKDKRESKAELLSAVKSAEDIWENFHVKLSAPKSNLSEEDIFKLVQKNIRVYLKEESSELDYAHVTFYKMHANQTFSVQQMDKLETGVSMNGLYSAVPSRKFKEDYRSGFGTQDLNVENNLLLLTSFYTNELAANMTNGARNAYVKGWGIVSTTSYEDLGVIEKILEKSMWATFVDPGVQLDFFEKLVEDLIVIHYSDQYSSSTKYDAITVTKKSKQFFDVIQSYLSSLVAGAETQDDKVREIISEFNTINGEWLLKIVGSRGQFTREKLSIIGSIKMLLAYLEHPSILWVPISMEEILRVAGAVSLNKKDGIFTAKNLGAAGAHSDDVLFIGLEQSGNDLMIHLYPAEVKVGQNTSTVIKKAHQQIEQTVSLLKNELIHKEESFMKKFHQNFFVQLFISNAKRMAETNFFPSHEYALPPEILKKLKNGDYSFSVGLSAYVGNGAIVNFKTETTNRSNKIEEQILMLNLAEDDVAESLLKTIDDIEKWIIQDSNELVHETILKYSYKTEKNPDEPVDDVRKRIMKFLY